MKRFVLLFITVLLIQNINFPQEGLTFHFNNEKHTEVFYNIGSDITSFYKNGISFIESPLHFDTNDLILTGAIISAAGLSFNLDKQFNNSIGKIHSNTLDKMTVIGQNFGEQKYGMLFGGLLYTSGFIIKDQELRKTGLMLTEAMFFSGMITGGLKTAFGRSRPSNNEGNNDIDFLAMESDVSEHSFPSGHATVAFTLASVLSERMGNPYATAILYSLAGFTAFERIYDNAHWFSGVAAGAAIGTATGLKIVKLYSHEHQQSSGKTIFSIMPMVSNTGYGMNVSLNF